MIQGGHFSSHNVDEQTKAVLFVELFVWWPLAGTQQLMMAFVPHQYWIMDIFNSPQILRQFLCSAFVFILEQCSICSACCPELTVNLMSLTLAQLYSWVEGSPPAGSCQKHWFILGSCWCAELMCFLSLLIKFFLEAEVDLWALCMPSHQMLMIFKNYIFCNICMKGKL